MSNARKKVGVGWLNTSQDGNKKYISIEIDGGLSPNIHLVLFENGFKKSDNQPDYIVYLGQPKKATAPDFPTPDAADDDDIPF